MTKVTDVSSKTGLYDLTVKLNTELTNLNTEVTSIQGELNSVTNIDGMNFQGAAQLISNNLKNVLSALSSLQGTVSSYITELENFDKYEDPGVNPELNPPEMTEPGTTPTTPGTENPENTENQENTENPENAGNQENTGDTGNQENTGNTGNTGNNNSGNTGNNNSGNSGNDNSGNSGNDNSGNDNSGSDNNTGNDNSGNDNSGNDDSGNSGNDNNNGNTGGGNSGGDTGGGSNTPTWEPTQQQAEGLSYGVGDPAVDVSNYTNNPELGYTVTTGNMSYGLNNEDYSLLCAVVAAESDGTYDGTMSVISAILNRCEDSNFKGQFGMDPIAQITGTNMFSSYTSGDFQKYLGNTSDIVNKAVSDALAGVRNHASCNY